jgi:hypothetical protein
LVRALSWGIRNGVRATTLLFLRPSRSLLVAAALLGACAHHNPDARVVGLSDREYLKLTTKAHAGDAQAAEKLARLWYQNSQDNAKALYWLDVAAQSGSKRAERYSQLAKTYLRE